MEYVMISLLCFSILLFIISLFLKDPYKTIREEIDQLSMQQIQDMYLIKKKLKVLEEELLISDDGLQPSFPQQPAYTNEKKDIHEIIKNQVWALIQQGHTVEQAARQSSLTITEVEAIISEMIGRTKI
ncbi:hypothetical protein J2Z40_002196 [Cytobacillus eiseniae]|uniref:Resolvase HTH domain-containing protein n=1 Tax=Cytobacillus eiseniae TaxID=762947 RepID=A0ABS4RFZ0_9BACI|nr:hypothetical protein [Cytobacillus eiseniae]MBP2241624.1 hypothetical protein [Cytobacillus eiseniae]